MKALNAPNTLSRRTWLRNTAIATTSAVVVPSMLIGCSDHRIPPGVGLLDPPITLDELKKASTNLVRMEIWCRDLHDSTGRYTARVYWLLKAGVEAPTSWNEIVVDIFTEIGLGVLEAALEEFPGVGPTIAATVNEIKKWGMKQKEGKGVDATIAEFVQGYDDMYEAISYNLLIMADAGTDNQYKNLQEAFKGGEIEFNGEKYTLRDLANLDFPFISTSKDVPSVHPAEYAIMRAAAELKFKKYIWNAMFMKAGTMTYVTAREVDYPPMGPGLPANNPTRYAREEIYNDPFNAAAYNAVYLRAYFDTVFKRFYFRQYYWTFDGLLLSEGAVNELFQDDTPEHIINPNGLFLRSYVFKQFHTKKPDFDGYHNLRKDLDWGPLNTNDDCFALDCPDNYEFTGGEFPVLTKK